ncbi:MAG: guanylate kinase [Lachnospiraceae bacterium]|nr:guanylate kinase [Lachnospiraceae bacterium]MBQ7507444.1 guanylate kinase [Lachnospiraceae bacterium]
MKSEAVLAVVSGFAGSGKGSVMKGLMKKYPDHYFLSVSKTTRSPRPGEEEGREYFFVTDREFEEDIEKDALLEYAGYVGHYYGTPKAPVEGALSEGKNVLLEIEIQGALKVKEKYPEAVLLFLSPPSAEELKERLTGRGTEDAATIKKRLKRASEESLGIEKYDYLVINDSLEECIEEVHEILLAERRKTKRQTERIRELVNGMKVFAEGEETE